MRLIQKASHLLRARLADERGFSLITVSMALMVVMLASAAALGAADGDHGLGRDDVERKQAYAAAEAGLHDYIYHLNSDNSYWAKCTNVAEPHAVNQRWGGSGTDPRRWRSVPQPIGDPRADRIEYAIELLPANGQTQCNTNNAAGTMLDSATGTFRIRSTGRVQRPDGSYEKRSVIAQFRRKGFLDYLYFTDYETSDPAWYELYAQGRDTNPNIVAWASEKCSKYWRDGRDNEVYNGSWYLGGWYGWQPMSAVKCSKIQFADSDQIRGPLHTNDDILVCGSPAFGRPLPNNDAIEISAPGTTNPDTGWRSACGGSQPNFIGEWKPNSEILSMPPSNTKLRDEATGYIYTGRTELQLDGNSVRVTNAAAGLSNTMKAIPPNGVIYVENGNCGETYKPLAPYSAPAGCADVYVKGAYTKDLTIASEKDIIVWGSVTKAADNMLGLIANNFVRVYKPASNLNAGNGTCSNATGTMQNVRIDAAILALQHSFTVDHYFCGSPLQTLTVDGAIAQKYRGPVGTGNSQGVATGYTKDYVYDERLRLRQPPHFLDPIQAAWRAMRQWEQVPAR